LRVAGPSDFVVVVGRLAVAEGDRIQVGQVLAFTDTYASREATKAGLRPRIQAQKASIAGLEAQLENARIEDRRSVTLSRQGILADTDRDAARTKRQVAEANLEEARAQLRAVQADLVTAEAQVELATVRSPRNGVVLKIHAHAAERVGPEGILELGTTDQMYAIAEVYETDVTRVRPGQRARIHSPALPQDLTGTVERLGLKVGRLTNLGTDPTLKSDARVVDVEIRLDDSVAAAALTNLEVDVLIGG
jgi:HlyD family secretion protein